MQGTGTKRQKVLETIPETVTPAAESFAKEKGIYESLLRTKGLVREIMPSVRALSVDTEDEAKKTIAACGIDFPVGYGADYQEVSRLTGCF